jgi:hypothetical protein
VVTQWNWGPACGCGGLIEKLQQLLQLSCHHTRFRPAQGVCRSLVCLPCYAGLGRLLVAQPCWDGLIQQENPAESRVQRSKRQQEVDAWVLTRTAGAPGQGSQLWAMLRGEEWLKSGSITEHSSCRKYSAESWCTPPTPLLK